MRGQASIYLCKTQGFKPVKPGVSHFLHDLLAALFALLLNSPDQGLALAFLSAGKQVPVHAVGIIITGAFFDDAIYSSTLGHAIGQLAPRLHGIFPDAFVFM